MPLNTLWGPMERPGDPLLGEIAASPYGGYGFGSDVSTIPAPISVEPAVQAAAEYRQAMQQAETLEPRRALFPWGEAAAEIAARQHAIAQRLIARKQALEQQRQHEYQMDVARTSQLMDMMKSVRDNIPPDKRKDALMGIGRFLNLPKDMIKVFAETFNYLVNYDKLTYDQFMELGQRGDVPLEAIYSRFKDLPSYHKALKEWREGQLTPQEKGWEQGQTALGAIAALEGKPRPTTPPAELAPVAAEGIAPPAVPPREEPVGVPVPSGSAVPATPVPGVPVPSGPAPGAVPGTPGPATAGPQDFINGFYSPRHYEVSIGPSGPTVKIAQDRQPWIQETDAKTNRRVRYGKYGNEVQVIDKGTAAFYDQQTLTNLAAGQIKDPLGVLTAADAQAIINRGVQTDVLKARSEAYARKEAELTYAGPVEKARKLGETAAETQLVTIPDPLRPGKNLTIFAGSVPRLASQQGELLAAPFGKETAAKLGHAGRVLANIGWMKQHFDAMTPYLGKGVLNSALTWLFGPALPKLGKEPEISKGGALWGTVQNFLGKLPPEQAEFYQRLVDTVNSVVYMQSGSQITVEEMSRLQEALFSKWQEPATFRAYLHGADKIMTRYAYELAKAETTPGRYIAEDLQDRLKMLEEEGPPKRTGVPKVQGEIRWK